MRALLLIIATSWFCGYAVSGDCGSDATPEQIANAVKEALRQKEPLSDGKLVVSDAKVAEAIHVAVAGAVYGKKQIERERPFRAVRSGDFWVVYGCLPKDTYGGVAVTVIRAKDGAVISITSGQ
jgi:hypothetical protein